MLGIDNITFAKDNAKDIVTSELVEEALNYAVLFVPDDVDFLPGENL